MCKHCKNRRRHHKVSVTAGTADEYCQCGNSFHNNHFKESQVLDKTVGSDISPSAPISQNYMATDSNTARTPICRPTYLASDLAPYTVHILREQADPNNNRNIHPVSFGHFLK